MGSSTAAMKKIHRLWFSGGSGYIIDFGQGLCPESKKQNLRVENKTSDYVLSKESCCTVCFVCKKKIANLDPYQFLRAVSHTSLFLGHQFLRLEQMKSSPKRWGNSEVLRNMNSKAISRSCFFSPCHITYICMYVSIRYTYFFYICIYFVCSVLLCF